MSERIFIGVAWPYANGSLHIGQIAGAYLPADIFARYHRLKGNEVLMVSGSDQHGTPITIKAEQTGKTPVEIAEFYQREYLDCWQKLGISYDLYTTTGTKNHAEVAQDIFLKLLKKDRLYKKAVFQPYCPNCQRFLPDRYVEGTCPFCNAEYTRGDQCDVCGKLIDVEDLLNPHCKICGAPREFRESEHFFLKLSAFQEDLEKWAEEKKAIWRPNVAGLTVRYLKEGLKDRAITRDIEWGVPVPGAGFKNTRLYVWFEAVIGYLSASKEWAALHGDNNKWRPFWQDSVRSYYFIGKDNIPFHTLIWPAMLMGYEGLALPYDVPSNEFLTIEGRKISTSKNWAVWLPDYLSRYDPDPLRYMLSINMPETNDTDFSWREFVRRNNDELVATWGNLVNRVLTFTYKNFEGKVPTYEDMGIEDIGKFKRSYTQLELRAETVLANLVNEELANCRFKSAIKMVMDLAHETNRYLDDKVPWKKIKEDRPAAASSLYASLSVIAQLKTMLYPFLPFSSQKVQENLGFDGKIEEYGWKWQDLPAGQKLREPQPLFKKLDESIIEEETRRIGT
jgi:methionyl-tRNA synthetase